MARNVFISFRFSDGNDYKKILSKELDKCSYTNDYSEDKDRSNMSDESIKRYLYEKLRKSSITIVILTPQAINHQKKDGKYDDWMYDEIRYSLEDREGNASNALIALYVPESKNQIMFEKECGNSIYCGHECKINSINNFDNLCRRNMMNVKNEYKKNRCAGIYDHNYDSFCSLISFDEFISNIKKYIDIASEKRENIHKYEITKDLNKGN